MNGIKAWPHLALIGILFLVLGAAGAAFWLRHEQTADAASLPRAARIDRVNGDVGLNRSLDAKTDAKTTDTQWINAEENMPISVGDRIYTKEKADTSVAFTGRNFARLNENTSLDVLALADEKTQVALRDGSAVFDIGSLPSGNLFEVATPCGAVDLAEPGLYQVEINDDGNATATALSGSAQVVGQGGSGHIAKGEVLAVSCSGSTAPTLSRVEPRAAGATVDQYYHYRYPRSYDGRYVSYDNYLNDPFYYDPYRRYASYQYVSDDIPGVYDLDDYGDWQEVGDYGECWHPRVDTGWAPYQAGYWTTDYPYGLTWVSNEPWGYAPYHYGRWTFAGNQWFWVPDRVRTRPAYSPALVAFLPLESETIGWVALGPGDPYAPRYYDSNWAPRYLTRTAVVQERVINLNVPGAVTVVHMRDFNRVVDRRSLERVDPQQFARVRPVLDPFAVRNFRATALSTREAGRRFDLPPRMAERMQRPVIASTTPATPFRKDLAQRFQVREASEKTRGQQWQVRDNRPPATAGLRTSPQVHPELNQGNPNLAAEQARERQMADLSREAARGNRAARQQMQQLRQQQRQEQQQQQREQIARNGERRGNAGRGMDQQREQQQLRNQQPQPNRALPEVKTIPQAKGRPERQQGSLRQVQPQPHPQAQPRGRERYLGPPIKVPANRARPQPQPRPMREARPQPQPRPMREQPRPQPRPQAQPQAPRQQNQMRQQQQPRPQPQPQVQPQKQQPKAERRPPAQLAPAAAGQPQQKKGRGRP
jgi:hypothetical protein